MESSAPPRPTRVLFIIKGILALAILATAAILGGGIRHEAISIGPIKLDLILFGGVLLAIMFKDLLKVEAVSVGLAGLTLVVSHQLYMSKSLSEHLMHDHWHEAQSLINIFFLLLGFGLLAGDFKRSRLPDWLPAILPDDWKGGACILAFVLVISSFLDNIAAAMIGGVIAKQVFSGRVTVGYIAAIVACSNAGGAGSVIGDTTTTMMWIDGVSPLDVAHAVLGALAAAAVVIPFAAKQQQAFQPVLKDPSGGLAFAQVKKSWLCINALTLVGCIVANMKLGLPFVGVWSALLAGELIQRRDKAAWAEMMHMVKDAVFITCLVAIASLMPVKELPQASVGTTFALGWLSAVFDNIPLTKLALVLGGYDWGLLAFSVGYGGSITWFGSSAGVAISSDFPQAKSIVQWMRQGWFVPVGYLVGFATIVVLLGWHPHAPHR